MYRVADFYKQNSVIRHLGPAPGRFCDTEIPDQGQAVLIPQLYASRPRSSGHSTLGMDDGGCAYGTSFGEGGSKWWLESGRVKQL